MKNKIDKLIRSPSLYISLLLILSFFALGQINLKNQKPKFLANREVFTFNLNDKLLKLFATGQERSFSSLFWMETLLNSDESHFKGDSLTSWMFLRFNTITTLTPYFYNAYLAGGKYLSIIKDDTKGAEAIYAKGMKYFPNDYHLILNRAFNLYYEIGDTLKAIELYEKIIDHPLTLKHARFLPSLIQKMKLAQGNTTLEDSLNILLQIYRQMSDDPRVKKRYEKIIYSIRAEIDLKCLNSHNEKKCNRFDFLRRPYIKKENIYSAALEWKPFKIYKKNKK
jgi:tetratricopeptide (TPR) repeat protein